MTSLNIVISEATVQDAPEILALQRLAYQGEAALYSDDTLPPLTQTLEDLIAQFQLQSFLKAVAGGTIVGSVRGRVLDGVCHLGRLIVHPEFQGRGIGTQLMRAIEDRFAYVQRFELFTGRKSEQNLRLYRQLGYRAYRTELVNRRLILVYLEKINRHAV